nr:hypothetical protein [uncultured Pseudomonas sp.]
MPRTPLPYGDRTAVKSAIASKQRGDAERALLICGKRGPASRAAGRPTPDAFAGIVRTYRYHPKTSADPP